MKQKLISDIPVCQTRFDRFVLPDRQAETMQIKWEDFIPFPTMVYPKVFAISLLSVDSPS